jgi:hypothetical protein
MLERELVEKLKEFLKGFTPPLTAMSRNGGRFLGNYHSKVRSL